MVSVDKQYLGVNRLLVDRKLQLNINYIFFCTSRQNIAQN